MSLGVIDRSCSMESVYDKRYCNIVHSSSPILREGEGIFVIQTFLLLHMHAFHLPKKLL